jgi:hypothetical protein
MFVGSFENVGLNNNGENGFGYKRRFLGRR